ncbi:MAG TPA: FAD-binding oxidoreductase [Gemmatimonadota bacterium]|nr:FAD-binding oxidoreductase [Gemmatimonadota bacterium]
MTRNEIDRRRFLKLLGAAPLAASPLAALACGGGGAAVAGRGSGPATGATVVNDVHSGLNPTRVTRVFRPRTGGDVIEAVRAATAAGRPLAIAGGRHSMGGQQFLDDGWLLDMQALSGVRHFDPENGFLTVEAGIQWPELFDFLATTWDSDGQGWGIRQKQTGANRISIGGTLSANAHGRVLNRPPFVHDVESFVLVDAEGVPTTVGRGQNGSLFRLGVGGYGLFGVVTEVTLRLIRRTKVRRRVMESNIDEAVELLGRRAGEGHLYGDFQFSIDASSFTGFLRRGILATYEPVPISTGIPPDQRALSPEDWERMLALAHTNPGAATELYIGHYLGTDGQVYWSDLHQMADYREGYHRSIDARIGSVGSEMITEIYVRPEEVPAFMSAARAILRTSEATPVVYGTVRMIEQDEETFLPWAKRRFACIVFNLHVPRTPAGIERAAQAFRELIDEGLERGGSFYLTYHRWATPDQVRAAYPQFEEFLRLKDSYDPHGRFQSDWYRHYRAQIR